MITLHIYCRVRPGRAHDFERVYREAYVPAVAVQRGFQGTTLLRAYGQEQSAAIGAQGDWTYEIDIAFETEELRRAWASGPEHTAVWPQVEALCEGITWQGFDIMT